MGLTAEKVLDSVKARVQNAISVFDEQVLTPVVKRQGYWTGWSSNR